MARSITPWAGKIIAVLQTGNTAAALAQIKVAPTVKDLRSLQAALAGRWPDVDTAVADNIDALSAPLLRRAP
jgi:hypothetical protein